MFPIDRMKVLFWLLLTGFHIGFICGADSLSKRMLQGKIDPPKDIRLIKALYTFNEAGTRRTRLGFLIANYEQNTGEFWTLGFDGTILDSESVPLRPQRHLLRNLNQAMRHTDRYAEIGTFLSPVCTESFGKDIARLQRNMRLVQPPHAMTQDRKPYWDAGRLTDAELSALNEECKEWAQAIENMLMIHSHCVHLTLRNAQIKNFIHGTHNEESFRRASIAHNDQERVRQENAELLNQRLAQQQSDMRNRQAGMPPIGQTPVQAIPQQPQMPQMPQSQNQGTQPISPSLTHKQQALLAHLMQSQQQRIASRQDRLIQEQDFNLWQQQQMQRLLQHGNLQPRRQLRQLANDLPSQVEQLQSSGSSPLQQTNQGTPQWNKIQGLLQQRLSSQQIPPVDRPWGRGVQLQRPPSLEVVGSHQGTPGRSAQERTSLGRGAQKTGSKRQRRE